MTSNIIETKESFSADVAHWSVSLAEKIIELKPQKVLEFGCNIGKNLAAIHKRNKNIELLGVDINKEAISQGKKIFGLNLQLSDEEFFNGQEDNAFDIIFTCSVLDHLPDPGPVLEQMVRVAKHAVILLEPDLGTSGKVTKNLHPKSSTLVDTTPYSYSWDYEALSQNLPVSFSKTHYPLGGTNLGPYYFLYILKKNQTSRTVARDKISQAYLGSWGASATQERARNRINWLAKEATGATVLDIGCSEGILPILLGREDYKVLGIDVNPESLKFAQELLDKEDESVKNNVRFQRKNILTDTDFEEKFDTVVIAEVIEHLFHPEEAIEKAIHQLKEGGRLLLTTPFGYHPAIDHHQTFRLTDVVDILKQYLFIEQIAVVDGYIRIIGSKIDPALSENQIISIENILQIAEDAAIDAQKLLHSSHNVAIEQKKTSLGKLKKRNIEIQSKNQQLNFKVKELNSKVKELNSKVKEGNYKVKELNSEKKNLAVTIDEISENLTLQKQTILKLKKDKKQLSRKFKSVKATDAWKIGYVTVKAFNEPGINTILWIPRLTKIALSHIKTKFIAPPPPPAHIKKTPNKIPPPKKIEVNIPSIDVTPRLNNLRVAAILDDFSLDCFKYECDLKLVTPENWMSEITEYKPAFLFVESAWHGNGEAWVKQLTNAQDSPSSELISLVLWCRNRGIKTVFWNKEDPPNYNHFTNCARLFEYVFTTDENCIPKYLHDVGHDKVMALPFAAQPKIHNPISDGAPRENNVAFAGSWYANKHPDRKTDMENLLQPAMDFDLHIFDRNHDRADSSFKYPDNYHDAIKGGLPYSEMVVAYRKYKTFLNVNSVQNSPTMFSRRVFELLACNTTVISGYSTGIENMLGDLVLMTRSQKETRKHLENILSNEYSRERLAHQGMRKVLTEHTYKNRLNSILEFIGIQSTEDPEEKVSVITYTNKPEMLDRILSNYERQLHPNKELVLILNNNFFNKDKVKKTIKKRNIVSATVIQLPENSSLGTCLNTAIEASTGEYLTKFDDKNHYADYFISDLLLPFEYTEAHIVGKCSYYTYLEGQRILALHSPKNEHKYVKFIHDSAMLVKREIFKKIRFAENSLDQNANFSNDCIEAGYKMYSADRFNYVCIQPDVEKKHMSKTEQDSYLQECEIVATVDNYEEITNVTDNVYYCN